MANCSILGNLKGAGQIQSTVPGRVCQHCCQTEDELISRKASNSRDKDLEKRKEDTYFRYQQLGEVKAQALTTDLFTGKRDTRFYEERPSGYMQESRQRSHDPGWGLVCVQQ